MDRVSGAIEHAALMAAVEQAADGIILTDTRGTIQYANPAFTIKTGYTREEVLGKNPSFLKSGRHPAQFYEELWNTIQAGKVWCGELINRRKDGSFHNEEMRISPVRDSRGMITGYIAIKHDISERLAAQEALSRSRQFAQSTLDALSSHLCVLDETGTILSVNRAWEDFAAGGHRGDPPDPRPDCASQNRFGVGVNYLEVCDRAVGKEAAEAAAFATGIRSVLSGERAGFSKEYTCSCPQQERWFLARVTRFFSGALPRIIVEHIDITASKRREELLRESEERFRTMADGCPSLMWVTGAQGETQFLNRAYRDFLGVASSDKDLERWHLRIHPEDAPAYTAAFYRAVKERTSFSAEVRMRRADGEWRLLGSKAGPRISPSGEYLGLVALSADITDREQAKNALVESEERFRTMADGCPVGIWVTNAKGAMCYANQFHMQHCGITFEQGINNEWRAKIHPDDAARFLKDFDTALNRHAPFHAVRRSRRADGQWRWMESNAVPRFTADREFLGFVGTSADVTERRESEEVLRNSEEKFRQLAENIREVFWVMNAAGTEFLYVGPAYEQIWGRSCASLYKNAAERADAIHPDDRELAQATFLRQLQGEIVDSEYRIVTPQGTEKWVRDRAFPIRDRNGELTRVVGITEEITEKKRHQLELIRLRQDADAANRAKGQFLANMSHEIRTPMNGVIGMNQLLLKTELTPQQRRYVEVIQSSGKALLSLIDDILDMSKIEAGKLTLEDVTFSLAQAVHEVVQMLRIQAGAKHLSLVSRVSSQIPDLLRGDTYRLQQVLTNLLSNAIKFTEIGEITLAAHLAGQEDGAISIRFTVTDTGIGMAEEQVPTLFAPFAQADASTTRRYGGSGLGLSISKQIVEMMGGTISAESRLGHGSTFWFTATFAPASPDLRRAPSLLVPAPGPTVSSEAPLPLGHGEKILIAEDNPTNREVLLAQLRCLGYCSAVAMNGLEAVEAVQSEPFSLILMDCQMPLMDGYEATQLIRQSPHAHLPIVALTAGAMMQDRERCLREGMNDHLAKPVDLHQLATMLARFIPASGPRLHDSTSAKSDGHTPAFNVQSLSRRLMGDRELAAAVVQSFLDNAPSQLRQLCACLEEGDALGVQRQAHSLKGAAATAGADALHTLARAIESDAAEFRFDRSSKQMVRAMEEFDSFRNLVWQDKWLSGAASEPEMSDRGVASPQSLP